MRNKPNTMKARIDTAAKTIAIDEAITLDELVKFVKALFPENWKEWKVDPRVTIEIASPTIVVERHPSQPWGPYWYERNPLYTLGTSTGDPHPETPTTFCLSTN